MLSSSAISPPPGKLPFFENPQDVTCGHAILWDSENTLPEEVLYLDVSSRAFVLGVGCRRGVKPQELRLVAERYLSEFGLNAENIASIATCTVKEDEPAILGLGEAWQVPVAFHSAEELDAVPVSAPSEKVREKVGHRFGVRGRVPAVRRIRLNPPARTVRPEIRLWRRHAGTGPSAASSRPQKRTKGKSSWPGSDRALPATSRRMSTQRSGGVTPSPATAITSTSSGTASPESP